ncbi:MAG TPA: nuclear transport factor 2 family protein [Pseudomonas sp.]|jgi:hypothetical protein
MTSTIDSGLLDIYEAWHTSVCAGDLAATAALYSEQAIFETPLVLAVYPQHGSGVLVGRALIHQFMDDSKRKFPNDLVEWYRSDKVFINGRNLTWEYPRKTPNGQQVDLMEMMEIENGLITYHRVYWGWYGVQLLGQALVKAQLS